MITNNHMTAV